MTSSRSRAAVPINTAEAIVEPFWDPQLSGLAEWKIRAGARHGLKVSQIWCAVAFEWVDRPVSGPALSLSLARRLQVRFAPAFPLFCSFCFPSMVVPCSFRQPAFSRIALPYAFTSPCSMREGKGASVPLRSFPFSHFPV